MRILLAALVAAALLAPAAASAQTYPKPQQPGPVQSKPKGPHKTHTVCRKKGRCDFRTIQKAVNKARAGDTIRVRNGVYREAVKINGKKKRYLRLIGNPAKPKKVVLRARGNMQNGIFVNAASEVTVNGFMTRDYKSNGFFFTNVRGYTMNHLVARHTGVYGLYAFNSIGGRILNSEAYYVNDGAFYIGQTPPQAKPVRTIVSNVSGWGSPLGFSATNMRYVTITRSRFYNNAAGIVPNALDSEKFPPPEDNEIIDNDIFWNNFNYHQGNPPFAVRKNTTAALVPVGTGVLLLGGRGNRIENNRVHGNFLAGVAAIEGILLVENPDARSLERNIVRNNQFGLNGTDTNGSDLMYDGNGSDNCFSLDGVSSTFPADRSTFAGCGGPNAFSKAVQDGMLAFTGEGALAGWAKHAHPAKKGYTPLEVFK
jgi:Pectinesterase